ncbi:MAG: hypothetical protein WBB23_07585 [Desulforhopalus sp.]
MQFCKDCGTVLNIFGTHDRELCSSCIQHKIQFKPPVAPLEEQKAAAPKPERLDLLAHSVLLCENNKIILRSKEGWELWSGPSDAQTDLKTILEKAGRIYEIRLRRQKS